MSRTLCGASIPGHRHDTALCVGGSHFLVGHEITPTVLMFSITKPNMSLSPAIGREVPARVSRCQAGNLENFKDG